MAAVSKFSFYQVSEEKFFELLRKIRVVFSKKYVAGYQYICPNCGRICSCEEDLHPNGSFVPVWIICNFGCMNRWVLEAMFYEYGEDFVRLLIEWQDQVENDQNE